MVTLVLRDYTGLEFETQRGEVEPLVPGELPETIDTTATPVPERTLPPPPPRGTSVPPDVAPEVLRLQVPEGPKETDSGFIRRPPMSESRAEREDERWGDDEEEDEDGKITVRI